MFAMPMACLLLMVSGQAVKYDTITDPDKLIAEADRVVSRGEISDLSGLIQAVQKLMEKTKEEDQKERLNKTLDELERFKKLESDKKFDFTNTNQDIDQNLFHQYNTLMRAIPDGKESFLACRPVILQTLNKPRNPNLFNKSIEFEMRKALQDMDRLEQLDKDPAMRSITEDFLNASCGKFKRLNKDESANTASEIKLFKQAKGDAASLFGRGSFLYVALTYRILDDLITMCRCREMTGVDLEAECEKELGPLLNSEWHQSLGVKLIHLRAKANACLCAKEKNYEKLQRISKALDDYKCIYSNGDSFFFAESLSYRMILLTQMGRFQECLKEFENYGKKVAEQEVDLRYIHIRIDMYTSAATSYEALGNKELALLYQELAFGCALESGSPRWLPTFKKSIAKELRDKYAKNNQWREARNLEERCQLLGLGFDPLPKQAFEMAGAAPTVLNQPHKAPTSPPPKP
jgi:hypothetical protein